MDNKYNGVFFFSEMLHAQMYKSVVSVVFVIVAVCCYKRSAVNNNKKSCDSERVT